MRASRRAVSAEALEADSGEDGDGAGGGDWDGGITGDVAGGGMGGCGGGGTVEEVEGAERAIVDACLLAEMRWPVALVRDIRVSYRSPSWCAW